MRGQGFFVTGTDTGVGKTWFTLALMQAFQNAGYTVAGMKPVASGSERTSAGMKNEDALSIQDQSTYKYDYGTINPYAFEPPIAPHIAAADVGIKIDIGHIVSNFDILAGDNDFVIVEGVGGWRVPLGGQQSTADLVRALGLPVIMVVGLRLGCINHALLTSETIIADGVNLAGWVANHLSAAYSGPDKTIHTLAESVPAPLVGEFPYLQAMNAVALANRINTDLLWQRRNI